MDPQKSPRFVQVLRLSVVIGGGRSRGLRLLRPIPRPLQLEPTTLHVYGYAVRYDLSRLGSIAALFRNWVFTLVLKKCGKRLA